MGTKYVGEVVGFSGGGLFGDVKFSRNGREETKSFLATFVGKTAPPTTKEEERPAGDKTLVVTAEQLLKGFKEDLTEGYEKYDGRNLVVTGIAGPLKTDELELRAKGFNRSAVLCHFSPQELEKAKRVRAGQTVTVRGTFEELYVAFGSVALVDCRL